MEYKLPTSYKKIKGSFHLFYFYVIFLLFFLTHPFKPTFASTIFNDNFNDGNANDWVVGTPNSQWFVENYEYIGRVIYQGYSNPAHSYLPHSKISNINNYLYEIKIKGTQGVDKNILFRFQNIENTYSLNIREKFTPLPECSQPNPPSSSDIYLVKTQNNYVKILAHKQYENAQNIWYQVKVKVKNNNIQVKVNDESIFDVTDYNNPILTGTIGLMALSGYYCKNGDITENHYDDIIVSSIDEPSPTPTSTPTPSPTPTPKLPIVLIPGLGASYNRDGLIFNQDTQANDWKLFPFIKEYQGIKNTLIGLLGYQENKDFFIFAYDWRKEINNSAKELAYFINNTVKPKNPNSKIYLIGHSLGGLVSRTYTQKNPQEIKKIISVGSPHKGALQAYNIWEGAKIEGEPLQVLAYQFLLALYNRKFQTPLQTIRKNAPVVKDLLPTFDYLKKNGQIISESSLTHQNLWLKSLNQDPPQDFLDLFHPIVGTKGQADEYYHIKNPSWIMKILKYWHDGQPYKTEKGTGDSIVLQKSSFLEQTSPAILNLDHSELIYTKEGIKNILDKLNLSIAQEDIIPSEKTRITPALIFQLASPAELEIKDPSEKKYFSKDNLIFINNPLSGIYKATIYGLDKGKYRLILGQLLENNFIWNEYQGEININQIKTYDLKIDIQNPDPEPLLDSKGTSHLEMAIFEIESHSSFKTKTIIRAIIKNLQSAIKNSSRNPKKANSEIKKGITKIFALKRILKKTEQLNSLNKAIYHLQKAFINIGFTNKNKKTLQKELLSQRFLLNQKKAKLKKSKKIKNAISFLKAQELINKAKSEIKNKNLTSSDIYLYTSLYYLIEI